MNKQKLTGRDEWFDLDSAKSFDATAVFGNASTMQRVYFETRMGSWVKHDWDVKDLMNDTWSLSSEREARKDIVLSDSPDMAKCDFSEVDDPYDPELEV